MKQSVEYSKWFAVIKKCFPELVDSAEACFSAVATRWLPDFDLIMSIILVGRPAGGKTTTLKFFDEGLMPDLIYYSDHFTPKSFVSHVGQKGKSDKMRDKDLLPRIKDKIWIAPELAPVFAQPEDRLMESIGVLTRVLDGQGYVSDSGMHGRRGYQEPIRFIWLAGTTPISRKVWRIMAHLGTKMYFYNMSDEKQDTRDLIERLKKSSNYGKRMKECQNATFEFMQYLQKTAKNWTPKSINDEDETLITKIAQLAMLVAKLRASLSMSFDESWDTTKQKIHHTIPEEEDPLRAAIMFLAFARSHAFIQGRNCLSKDDIPLAMELALSSAPTDRVRIFKVLINNGGRITSVELEKHARCSRSSAVRMINMFHLLGIAVKGREQSSHGKPTYAMELVDEFDWCLKFFGVKSKKRIRSSDNRKKSEGYRKELDHTPINLYTKKNEA